MLSANGAICAIRMVSTNTNNILGSARLAAPKLQRAFRGVVPRLNLLLNLRPLVTCKQVEPILQQAAHEKFLAHSLLRARTEALAQLWILHDLHDPFGGLIRCTDQKSVLAIDDLPPNATHVAADHSGTLPH